MSLKGTEATNDIVILAEMKKMWNEYDPKKYGGAAKGTDEDAFDRFLCRHIFSLRKQVEAQVSIANRWRKQRNIVLILCAVFLVLSLFFAFRPRTETVAAQAAVRQSSSTAETFSEWTARQRGYVASVNSDKYHRQTCYYADNIIAENRIYFATENEAEDAGKSPCSACRP